MKSVVGQLGDPGVRALSTPVLRTAKGPASSPKAFPFYDLGYSLLNSRAQKGRLTLRGAGDMTLSRFPSGPEKDSGFGRAVTLRLLAATLTCSRRRRSRRPRPARPASSAPRRRPRPRPRHRPAACVTALRTESVRPLAPRRRGVPKARAHPLQGR